MVPRGRLHCEFGLGSPGHKTKQVALITRETTSGAGNVGGWRWVTEAAALCVGVCHAQFWELRARLR